MAHHGMTTEGLKRQMKYVEDAINIKRRVGKDTTFEEDLLKSWKQWLPGGKYHGKLSQ